MAHSLIRRVAAFAALFVTLTLVCCKAPPPTGGPCACTDHKTGSAYPVGALSGDANGSILPNVAISSMTGTNLGTPASTGAIRLPKNVAINARNGGNSADINLISTDLSSNIAIGDGTNSVTLLISASNTAAMTAGAAEALCTTGGIELLPTGSGVLNAASVILSGSGLQLFSTGVNFGGGTGIVGIGNASALFTSAPTSGAADFANDSIGLHYAGASTSFSDYMLAPVQQGTANTQANKSRLYSGVARTTTNSAVTILTIPCATSGSVCSMFVSCSGRDVTSGTVGDSFTYDNAVGFKNVSGTVTGATVQGTALNAHDTSMATVAVSYTVSGTNVLVQVTGLTSTTIDYTAEARVITN